MHVISSLFVLFKVFGQTDCDSYLLDYINLEKIYLQLNSLDHLF